MKTKIFQVMLILGLCMSASLSAQTPRPKPSQGDEFLPILSDCLAIRGTDVHECANRYAEVVDPSAIDDFSLGPGLPDIQATKIKGKYNTCQVYPKNEGPLGLGYSCFNNISGNCVTGDCCVFEGNDC